MSGSVFTRIGVDRQWVESLDRHAMSLREERCERRWIKTVLLVVIVINVMVMAAVTEFLAHMARH